MDDIAISQTLTHLTNISGFLREIAADLKAINHRQAAREARGTAKETPRPRPRTRP